MLKTMTITCFRKIFISREICKADHDIESIEKTRLKYLKSCISYVVECPYKHIGCYKDTDARAMVLLEGRNDELLGSNYKEREGAIDKCYQVAKSQGFGIFGLQHGGECWGSSVLDNAYGKYGTSADCKDGKGGIWANDVYQVNTLCGAKKGE